MPTRTKKTNGSSPVNDPNYFEGKPGPAPTGRRRKVQIPFMATEEEFEYMKRRAYRAGVSMNKMIRNNMIDRSWRDHLKELRKIQGANIPK